MPEYRSTFADLTRPTHDGAEAPAAITSESMRHDPAASRVATGGHGRLPAIAFVWDRFGPYHIDRCEATARRLAGRFEIWGIEIASFDDIYSWAKSNEGQHFRKQTLFPNRRRPDVPQWRCALRLAAALWRIRPDHVFFCNYEDPVIFAGALLARLRGARSMVMQDSKFDDKQRHLGLEHLKRFCYLPYSGALVGSRRSAEYLEFLGFRRDRLFLGYDTLSVARIRDNAGVPPAPDGVPHAARHFTVIARFVRKKNLHAALDAYALYRERTRGLKRELHLCGAGELEGELRAHAAALGLEGVRFRGFLQEREISAVLARSLALLLPSVEEQFGLVVNEAVAMGVPVLLSENCGARDLLVRNAVNGFVVEPDNADGLAFYMELLASDAEAWAALCRGSERFVGSADVDWFASTVERAIRTRSSRAAAEATS